MEVRAEERVRELAIEDLTGLIPEVRRQTRRRRLWIAAAIIVVVTLLFVAVGVSGANGSRDGSSARSHSQHVVPVIYSTNADAACSSVVSNLGDFKYPNAKYSWTGAYTSTAGQMNGWDQAIAGGSPLSTNSFTKLPQAELLDVCFVSGTFSSAPGAPIGGYKSAVMVVLPDGTWVADSFDYASTVPFSPPPTTPS
jgi:hypothetical protein